ncbi:MAG: sulfotransferase [Epsilonproteobacteria bacterium]|nr:sulfotransferase [Campylobacterota bacterium]
MYKVIGIGSAPSSGSTLLADLLDSTNLSAVGPELGLFSVNHIYQDFEMFKNNLFKSSKNYSIYLIRSAINVKSLSAYGLDENKLKNLVNKSNTYEDFFTNFAHHYLSLRGKNINGVVFEKTPQNLEFVKDYLKVHGNYFIHIVRNPIDVFLSLKKRNIPEAIALLTWYTEQIKILPFINDPRVILIKYEDLIKKPFKTVSEVMQKITGFYIEPEEIELNYKNNYYRKYHTEKLKTWNSQSFGKIEHKKRNISLKERIYLSNVYNLQISKRYAEVFSADSMPLIEMIEKFGYLNEFKKIVSPELDDKFGLDLRSKAFLTRKVLSNLKRRDFEFKDLSVLFKFFENKKRV